MQYDAHVRDYHWYQFFLHGYLIQVLEPLDFVRYIDINKVLR